MSLFEPISGPSVLFSFGIVRTSLDPISLVLCDFQYRYRTDFHFVEVAGVVGKFGSRHS
jgi:hypothetical protein